MKKLLAITAIGALVLLAGCSGGPEQNFQKSVPEASASAPATEPEVEIEPVVEVIEHLWAQDLWLFNGVRYYTVAGTEVDISNALPGRIGKWDADQTVQVAEDVEFKAYDKLKPSIVGPDGVPRADVDVQAGLMTFGDEEVFAVLATPHPDAAGPISHGDDVQVDFTFLGENFYPGIPMSFDFSFMQTWPGDDGNTTDPLELLTNRLVAEQMNFYGTEAADGPDLLMFSNAMGVAVEGSSRMSMSGKGKISDPGLNGFRKGVWSARKGGVGGVRGFFKKFGKGARGSNDLIKCNLGGPCGDPPGWTPPPGQVCIGFSCGSVSGDPHLETFDGLFYSPQAVGEFVLVESPALRVQMRTAPMGQSRTISVLTGVAAEAGGNRIMVAIEEGQSKLFLNDKQVPLGDQPKEVKVGTLAITGAKDRVQVVAASGERVTVMLGTSQLALFVDAGQQSGLTGMLGNANGPAEDDLATRDGAAIAADLVVTDPVAFYATFVDSWRVSPEESLFVYLPGQDTESFTDLTFPDEHMTLSQIPAKELKRATAVCEKAGIGQQGFLSNCIFDYWASENMDFVIAALQMDLLDGVASGFYQLDEATPPSGVGEAAKIPDGHGPKDGQSLEDYVRAQWSWDPHSRYTAGDEYEYFCPAGGTLATRIWGGGPQGYTSDSSVCTAAVHEGLITTESGGLVHVLMVAGQETYETLPPANGVTPLDWFEKWSYGYVFK